MVRCHGFTFFIPSEIKATSPGQFPRQLFQRYLRMQEIDTHNRLTAFFRDNTGRPVPEETPTPTQPDHQTAFIIFLHLQRSMASSLFIHYRMQEIEGIMCKLDHCLQWNTRA